MSESDGSVMQLWDDTFEEEVMQSSSPVLVDYWAEWCNPCKSFAPVLEEVARDYAGRLKVCKLNVDDNPLTPQRFGVRGIPTLMLFREGKPQGTSVGALTKSELCSFIDNKL